MRAGRPTGRRCGCSPGVGAEGAAGARPAGADASPRVANSRAEPTAPRSSSRSERLGVVRRSIAGGNMCSETYGSDRTERSPRSERACPTAAQREIACNGSCVAPRGGAAAPGDGGRGARRRRWAGRGEGAGRGAARALGGAGRGEGAGAGAGGGRGGAGGGGWAGRGEGGGRGAARALGGARGRLARAQRGPDLDLGGDLLDDGVDELGGRRGAAEVDRLHAAGRGLEHRLVD